MLEWMEGGWEEQEVCFRAGDEIGRRGERGEDLQLAYPFPWLEGTKVVKINN